MRISDWSSDVCSSDLSGQGVEHQGSAFIVAHLSFAQQHDQRPALAVADGMELRVQTAFGASDTSGNSPFLSRLAAVRCALRWVASIINWSGFPRLAARAAKILLNTPSLQIGRASGRERVCQTG